MLFTETYKIFKVLPIEEFKSKDGRPLRKLTVIGSYEDTFKNETTVKYHAFDVWKDTLQAVVNGLTIGDQKVFRFAINSRSYVAVDKVTGVKTTKFSTGLNLVEIASADGGANNTNGPSADSNDLPF